MRPALSCVALLWACCKGTGHAAPLTLSGSPNSPLSLPIRAPARQFVRLRIPRLMKRIGTFVWLLSYSQNSVKSP
eukprot:scaffold94008_cov20-Prasinocladus_malaysianus.AAC.1